MDLKEKFKKIGIYILVVLCSSLFGIVLPVGNDGNIDITELVGEVDSNGVVTGTGSLLEQAITPVVTKIIQEENLSIRTEITQLRKDMFSYSVDLMAYHLRGLRTVEQVDNMVTEWRTLKYGAQVTALDIVIKSQLARSMLEQKGFEQSLVNALLTK
jgi:hypothetical protein